MKMNNNLSASDYRSRARESLKGKYWFAVVVTFVATLLIGGGTSISFNMSPDSFSEVEQETTGFGTFTIPQQFIPVIAAVVATLITVVLVIAIAHFVITGVTQMGLAKYNVKLCMGEDANIKDLFAYYKTRIGTGMLATFLTNLFISLWSMLFVIPGIIASYRYVLVPYLLAEDDTLSASDAIKKSKELMKGNKWDLFCLELSFIGWIILGTITCGIGIHFVNPYINNARAHFYCELTGKNNTVELDGDAQEIDYTVDVKADTDAL